MKEYIKEQLQERGIELSYDSAKSRLVANSISYPARVFKNLDFYREISSGWIKKAHKDYEKYTLVAKNNLEKEIYNEFESIALENVFDSVAKTREQRVLEKTERKIAEEELADKIQKKFDELSSQGYEITDKGKIMDLMVNYKVALKNSDWIKSHKFTWNLFSNEIYIDGKQFSDKDYIELKELFGRLLQMDGRENILTSAESIAREHSYNPIQDFFTSGVWDGIDRLTTFFIDFIGADDTPLNREMTVKFFVGLVKRIFEPGCKWDNILIFIDETQGTGKSTLPERICDVLLPQSTGDSVYYKMDNSLDFDSKDNKEAVSKSVIINFDEVGALNKSDAESIKSFVSSTQVKFRKTYAITPRVYFLQCVYIGSSNDLYILKDYSGAYERRYWIMLCHGEKRPVSWWKEHLPDEYIAQVLYQAYHIYKSTPDMEVNLLSPESAAVLEELQQGHKTACADPMSRMLDELLAMKFSKPINKNTPTYTFAKLYREAVEALDTNMFGYSIESLTLTQIMAAVKQMKIDSRGHGVQWYGAQLKAKGWIPKKENINSSRNTVYYNPSMKSQIDMTEDLFSELNK